jgi:hypothetical protein
MNQQESLDWVKRQDVVKVRAFKEDEKDKFTFAVGEYLVSPLIFDSQEEAEQYLEDNFKLTNLDLSIIGAMCQKLNKLSNQQLKNEEK